jgi:hypothetical protein
MNNSNLPHRWQLVEVWGDTTDLHHLAWSIAIGIVVSLSGFFLANRWLAAHVSTPELARAYAMLAGLAGCILSGVICALLFIPKREVVDGNGGDPYWREEVLSKLAEQYGDLGSVHDLPAAVVQEMKELQIYDLFASWNGPERAATLAAGQPDAALKPLSGAKS